MALEILSYLTLRPDAQDTLEGIREWWVLERDRERQPHEVRAAVAELVADGFLVATRGLDQQQRYRLNLERREAALQLVNAAQSSQGEH